MLPKWQMGRVKPDRDFEEEILTKKHCAKWTKSPTKRQTLCDSTYMSTQTIKTRNRKPRKRLRLFSGYRSELCKRKSPGDRARAQDWVQCVRLSHTQGKPTRREQSDSISADAPTGATRYSMLIVFSFQDVKWYLLSKNLLCIWTFPACSRWHEMLCQCWMAAESKAPSESLNNEGDRYSSKVW